MDDKDKEFTTNYMADFEKMAEMNKWTAEQRYWYLHGPDAYTKKYGPKETE